MYHTRWEWTLFLAVILLCSSGFTGCGQHTDHPEVFRLAVTTSTRDTGLIDHLIEIFNDEHSARVEVLAVGTGQALQLGVSGDVDLVLVHDRTAEDAFMSSGHGVRREEIMYNTFEILGPKEDPAGVRDCSPVKAFRNIHSSTANFLSRGDDSGTHKREQSLWTKTGVTPNGDWYIQSGQGMGRTLIMADEMQAYVLTDRGTYLKFKDKISLEPLVQSSEELHNPYSALVVNPDKHANINSKTAHAFVDFLIAKDTQQIIHDFHLRGEPLFYPLRLEANAN
mgnify:FL=1